MNKFFSQYGWEEYVSWQKEDKKIVKKMRVLIK